MACIVFRFREVASGRAQVEGNDVGRSLMPQGVPVEFLHLVIGQKNHGDVDIQGTHDH